MKIKGKQILSMLLLAAMLLGLFPTNIVAQEALEPERPAGRAASYNDLTSTIQSLPQVKNERFDVSGYVDSNTVAGGTYYIVNMDYNGTTAKTTGRVIDVTQDFTAGGKLKVANVTVNNTSATNSVVSGAHPDMAIKLTSPASGNMRPIFTPVKGLGIGTAGVSGTTYPGTINFTRSTPTHYNAYYSADYDGLVFVSYKQLKEADGWHWYVPEYDTAAKSIIAKYYGKPNSGVPGTATNTFRLFRLAVQVSELYKAIKAVEGYAGGNSDGRFDSAAYQEFYSLLTTCIDLYTANNDLKTNAEQESLKTTLDGKATALLAAASNLDMTMQSKESYIDIPIEILDFRADGALFEWERHIDSRFGLRTTETGANGFNTPLGSKSKVYQGMTESELVNGQMIYKEGTVQYVAKVLQDVSSVKDEGPIYNWANHTDKVESANLEVYKKALSMKNSGAKAGTFAETIEKTDTKKNGGYLLWTNVTTFCDLAYYILNNMWRPVKSGDNIDTTNALGYNKVVPEVKRLRLFMDDNGMYTINAANRMSYNGFYAYSDSTFYPTDEMELDAFFRPIDNLGFEAPSSKLGDTDQGEYLSRYLYESKDTNFHFSMHAEGSFVYRRSDNLYFEFIGDDDVYFYINGKIAMDLGSSHDALGDYLYLNDKAAELGLIEGNVYSFDMFYIERHTTASNLKFSTNIEIVEKTKTEKSMYAETSGNTNTVDPKTGMGKELLDNALVRNGDVIAYSFDLANTRDIPVYNVAFKDTTLGTNISPSASTLTNTSLTGGIATAITDIELYYQCYDDESGEFYTGYPETKSVTEMSNLIDGANNGSSSFVGMRSYRVPISSTTELKNMLKKGVPAYCKLLVYGFKRLAQDSVPKYTNTVNSTCYYNLKGTGATTSGADDIAITASASRTYRVTAQPPEAEVAQIVLDYGKKVEIPVETIRGNIKTDALTTVTGFAGIVTEGSHGAVLTYLATSNLLCASAGKTYAGKQGTFLRTASGLTYQPTKFMDIVESIYLVYTLSATNSDYKYILIELKLLPATSVYYETDFSDSAFNNISSTGADYFDTDNAFYADFTNTELDAQRYKKSVYGGKNFDQTGSWGALDFLDGNDIYTAPVVDNVAGTLSVNYLSNVRNWIWVQTHKNLDSGFCLNYHPHSSHVAQIRVKFNNLAVTTGATPYARIDYFIGPDRWEGDRVNNKNELLYSMDHFDMSVSAVTSGEYVTITFPVKGLDSTKHTTLSNLRFQFGNVVNKNSSVMGGVTFDYIYVGPANNAPLQDKLFFDFSDSDTDRNRYGTHNYLSQNFDMTSAWQAVENLQSITVNGEANTLDLTAGASLSDTTAPRLTFATKGNLSYDPANAEVVQLRFKMQNFVRGRWTENGTAKTPDLAITLSYSSDGATWLEAGTKRFSPEYIASGEYVTLQFPVNKAFQSAKNIRSLRFTVSGVESNPAANPGVMALDYIHIGKRADVPTEANVSDYLFFDFTNNADDRKRYADNPAYGGYNYDSEYWSGRFIFSSTVLDNEAGTLTFASNTAYDGSSGYDTYFQPSGSVPNYFDLQYNPAKAEVAVLRFKLENYVANGTPGVRVSYYLGDDCDVVEGDNDTDELYSCDYRHPIAAEYLTNSEYVTVTIPVPELKAHERISTFRFQFLSIKPASGKQAKLTVDYVYVGPKNSVPIEKGTSEYLYFDFDNTDADQERYANDPVYGGFNFDAGNWATGGTIGSKSFSINTGDGTVAITVKDSTSDYGPYFATTKTTGSYPWSSGASYAPLNFRTSDDTIVKLRFKVSGCAVAGATEPNVALLLHYKDSAGTAKYTTSLYKNYTYTEDKYLTLAFNLFETFTSGEVLNSVGFRFRHLDGISDGKVTVDYIYVGPEDAMPTEEHSTSKYLYFDFDNTDADRERYANEPAYNGNNYDNPALVTKHFTKSVNMNGIKVDNATGHLEIVANMLTESAWPDCYTNLYKALNFRTADADYFEMRFKLNNFVRGKQGTEEKNPYFTFACFGKIGDSATSVFKDYNFGIEHLSDGVYMTVKKQIPSTSDFYKLDTFEGLRFYFGGIESDTTQFDELGTISIDYIFLGKKADIEKAKAENIVSDWQTVNEYPEEYQDQTDLASTNIYQAPSTDISTKATEAQVLASLGVTNVLGAAHAQRNEYFGLTNGKSNYANKVPSTIAHRGSFRTSSEDSYLAVMDALQLGIDNVEIDLQITSDGVIVLCHDDTVTRTMTQSGAVSSIAWNTLRDYPLEIANGVGDKLYYTLTQKDADLLNSIPNYTAHYGEAATVGGNHYTARFDDLLDLLALKAPNAMLTLDKVNTQDKFVAIYKLLRDKNMLGQAMFSMNTAALNNLNTWATAAATVCGISQTEVKDSILVRYSVGLDTGTITNMQNQLANGNYLKVVEYTYTEAQAPQVEEYLTSTLLPFLKGHKIDFYPSAIGPGWAGGKDDVETTWLHYLRMGADAIMTDRAEELAGFMRYYNGTARTIASELIEAEHFQNYNYDTAKFYMKEAADLNNNKLVNEMHANDWLQYNKITFSGSETKLYVTAKGIAGGVLKFYADSMTESNCFAIVNVANSKTAYTQTVTMLKKVAKGTHTVYVKAEGENAQALISFDAFSCKNFTNSNYLYFGFSNTPADQTRYQNNSAYGGYIFDTAANGYWATNNTNAGTNAETQFTIDNTNGVAVINVGTAGIGPEFMTTNTYSKFPWRDRSNYAPLKYTPSKSDFLTVRFMISGCTDIGDNQVQFEFWHTDGKGTAGLSYLLDKSYQVWADYTFVQNKYITVTIALPDSFSKDTVINSIGLRFCGLQASGTAGKVTVDYIYVGPMPGQQTDHLLIDFDGDAEDYSDLAYGGRNYDLTTSWTYSSKRSTAPTISDGALKFESLTTCDVNHHRMMSEISLRYTPGIDEYIQVRFRAENAVAVSGTTPTLNVYWSPDAYSRTYLGYGDRNNSAGTIDLTTTDWQTVSIRMDTADKSAYYRDAEVIGSLCVMFNNVAVSKDEANRNTFYIDYVYIGPLDKAPDYTTDSSLFFDFDNADSDRYNAEKYGYINFDEVITADKPTTNHWMKHTGNNFAASAVSLDNEEGTLALTAKPTKSAVWTETSKSGTTYDNPLKFAAADAQYFQIRFKCQNFSQYGTSKPLIRLYPGFIGASDITGGDCLAWKEIDVSCLSSNQYQTIGFELPSDKYAPYEYLSNVRVMLANVSCTEANPGIFTIDYIYVGTKYDAPSANDSSSVFFDFTDTGADRTRYDERYYGNVNYDDETVKHWYESTSTSNGAGTSAVVDNSSGTLAIKAKSTITYAWVQPVETLDSTAKYLDAPLNLPTQSVQYCQIRFKCENFKQYDTTTPFIAFYPRFENWSDIKGTDFRAHHTFDKSYLSNGEYQTLTFKLPTQLYSAFNYLKSFRIQLTNVSSTAANPGIFTIDYIYVGAADGLPTNDFVTYGYDTSYLEDSDLSNGSSLFVEGSGIPLMNSNKSINYSGASAFTESSFTFSGTGFDIISRTGAEQGQIRAVIYDSKGNFVKVAQVLNKSDLGTELKQIPVLSVDLVNYDTYHVKIFVAAAYTNADIPALDRGSQFFFDAVRIYNPINTAANTGDAATAYAIYRKHAEADPTYTELRSTLITDGFGSIAGSAVYLDAKTDTDYLRDKTPLAQYTEVGPNNEVYLTYGKAIAFKLSVSGILPASIDIGAKSVNGKQVKLVSKVTTSSPSAVPAAADIANGVTIESATQQYYPLNVSAAAWKTSNAEKFIYVTIYNAGHGILSITDIKCGYDTAVTRSTKSVRFHVDQEMLDALNICYAHDYACANTGESHTFTCKNCSYSYLKAHSFEDGVCACGAIESTEPELDESLKFNMNIMASSEMVVNYNFMASVVDKYESFYLEVRKDVAGGEARVTTYGFGADHTPMGSMNHPATGAPLMYNASYTGINAKEMGDKFATTLYAIDADGKVFRSETVVSSIKDYLLGKLEDEKSIPTLKTMAVDMLKYGEAAQIIFNYNTENLVTADLMEEQLSYATAEVPEATDVSASSGTGAKISANVTVGAKVQLYVSVIKSGLANPDAVRCEIRDADGNLIAEPEVGNVMDMMYSATYDNVGAKEMRKPIHVTFCMGDEVISQTITWSIESYVSQIRSNENSTEADIAMVNAMLTYGDAVAAYLTAIGQ